MRDIRHLLYHSAFPDYRVLGCGSHSQVGYISILFLALNLDARPRHFLAKELRSRLTASGKLIEEERKTNPGLHSRARRRWWRAPISTLLHRSNTLHAETNDETDPHRSSKKHKNRRVRPHMIHRIDEKPKLINPSGLVNQDRMPIAQTGLLGSQSTSPRLPIIEQPPTDSTFSQSPEHTHSQPFVQQSKDSDAESGSELEDLNEAPRRGRRGREALSSLIPPAVIPPPNHSLSHPSQPRSPSVTRTQTVEFAPSPQLKGRHQAKPSVDEGHVRAAGELLHGCALNIVNLSNRTGGLRPT